MSDYFDERLAAAAARLEQESAVRSPAGVRARGDQRRRRHTATMAVVPVAVLAIAGTVGLTLRPSGGSSHHDPGARPTVSATPTASTPPTTPSTKAAAAPSVRVDLADHTLTVLDKQGKTVKTLQITGGSRTHPTPTGTFAVTDKEPSVEISSVMPGMDNYSMRVYSYIALGTNGPLIFGAPWRHDGQFGTDNVSHGAIELAANDATWLYGRLAVGDTVQITAGPAQ